MSHTLPILRGEDYWELECVKRMCANEANMHFMENQTEFTVYTGQESCLHAIKVDDCAYQIGVTQADGKWNLETDLYYTGGLGEALGSSCGKLHQVYDVAKFQLESEAEGMWAYEEAHTVPEREGWMKMVAEGGSW